MIKQALGYLVGKLLFYLIIASMVVFTATKINDYFAFCSMIIKLCF